MHSIAIIAHNLRSAHNVGSLLRTADGFGAVVYLTGYTPYPALESDKRLLHLSVKLNRQIAKTSLGAEKTVQWQHSEDINQVINQLKADGYKVAALEQTKNSLPLPAYNPPLKLALIVGREVEGLEAEVLRAADVVLEIPMSGKKESLNVAVAAAIGLYHTKFASGTKKR